MPYYSQADVLIHGLWKWGTSALFDMGYYLCQASAKTLAMAEKDKKEKYLYPCLGSSRSFTPIVYSMDGITGTEAIDAQQSLDLILSNNLNQEYLDMCGFLRGCMSLEIVRSNTLILCGTRDKEAYIRQRPYMADGAVMSLLAPCRG